MENTLQVATAFGLVLRRRRHQARRTQEVLGFEAELQRNFISELERGLKIPSLGTVCQLARALGCSAADLVSEAEAVMLGLQAARGLGAALPPSLAVHEAPAPYAARPAPAPTPKAGRSPRKTPAPAKPKIAQPKAQAGVATPRARTPQTKRR